MTFTLRSHPDHEIVIFRYRNHDISIHNGPVPNCAVFAIGEEGTMTSGPVNGKTFSGDAEGIRKAMYFIDKLAGPKRICVFCKKPVGSSHKYISFYDQDTDKQGWKHRCCAYPYSYTIEQGKKWAKRAGHEY